MKNHYICKVFAVVIVTSLILSIPFLNVYADGVSDARKDLESIKNQIKENESQIKNVESEVSKKLKKLMR